MRLTRHEVHVGGGINPTVHAPNFRHDATPVYSFTTSIDLEATVTWPEERTGELFSLTVYGERPARPELSETLRDYRKLDADGAPMYRKSRSKAVPVYDLPPGAGYLSRVRGQPRWTGAVWVFAETATAMVALLAAAPRRLFVFVHELRVARKRWIKSLSLQTTDPAEE